MVWGERMVYRYPMDGYRLGAGYGKKGSLWAIGWHTGQDFFSDDLRVYPVTSGKVEKITTTGSYGNCIRVRHDDGYMSLYAHLAELRVEYGQRVDTGMVIGIAGSTGNSTAVHLHLEIHDGAYRYPAEIDPIKFLDERIAENDMTREEVLKLIEQSVMVYHTPEEIPEWGRATVDKLMEKGYLRGGAEGIDITYDMLRLLVINDRAGLY